MDVRSIKKLLNNMFIAGFSGETPSCELKNALKNGLGGVIFFSDNIIERKAFKNTVNDLKKLSNSTLITSIDQEGGLVERTINLCDKVDYLTPAALAQSNNVSLIKEHYDVLFQELLSFGINMNFAPVLDVNTVCDNSIIGIRSFSHLESEVTKFSQASLSSFAQNGILSVGKHFPGHGHCKLDSHKGMVKIDLDFETLEKIHIKPFKEAIKKGADAIMVAHAIYPAFDCENPASLSPYVISYLRETLDFDGVVISDDMVMGAISKFYEPFDACKKAIDAGVNMLIFRNFSAETKKLIDDLSEYAKKNEEFLKKIEFSNKKINECKSKIKEKPVEFNPKEAERTIFDISKKTFRVLKKEKQLSKNSKVLILRPKRSDIHSYKTDSFLLSKLWGLESALEVEFSLNPGDSEIKTLIEMTQDFEDVVFVSYNAVVFEGQQKLLKSLTPDFGVCAGVEEDKQFFESASFCALLYGYKKYGFINLKDELIINL